MYFHHFSSPDMHPDIILFDGVCNFCNHSINFVIDHDSRQKFKFASLQSTLGQTLLASTDLSATQIDSVVYIHNGKAYIESTAALNIARQLDGLWSWLYVLKFVPQPLRDWGYRLIAKNRYRLFGKQEACRIPTPELKSRFLED